VKAAQFKLKGKHPDLSFYGLFPIDIGDWAYYSSNMDKQYFLTSRDRSNIFRTDLNNLRDGIFDGKIDVVYDTIDDEKILKFSKLKNGSGIITRQFGKDLALNIKNVFGEQIDIAPGEWGIVSIGSSKFLGRIAAQNLGLSHAHIRLDDFSLLKVRNYDAVKTLKERKKLLYSKHFTLETRGSFKSRNIILVDDMLNRGVSLTRGKEFLEGKHGLHVAGTQVLFSIAHVQDASLEVRMSKAFIETEGISALIKMLNDEEFFVTRHLLKNIFYEKDRLRNLLALNANKRLVLIAHGIVSISAKIWVLIKAKVVNTTNMVTGGMSNFILKSIRKVTS